MNDEQKEAVFEMIKILNLDRGQINNRINEINMLLNTQSISLNDEKVSLLVKRDEIDSHIVLLNEGMGE